MRRLATFVLGMLWLAALAAAPVAAADLDPVLASTNGDGIVNDAVVVGDLAYCASGGGLTIWDISGSTPRYLGACDTRGFAISVAVAGQRAYVGTITLFFLPWTLEIYGGLEAIDVSRPARPTLLGRCDVPAMAPGQMAVSDSGDYLYVVEPGFGLWIFDVSDPDQPVVAATHQLPPSSQPCACVLDVATAGDYAYLATDYGLIVMDLSAPAAPVELGPCPGVENAFSVAITGRYAVVNSWSGNPLSVLDISDPASPVVVGVYPGDLGTGWGWLAAAGDMAYVLDQDAAILRAISIAEPNAPVLVGEVAISQSFAYLAANPTTVCLIPLGFNWAWDSIMTLVDVSAPAHPVIMGSTPATGVPFAVAARDRYAFVLDAGSLQAVDVSNPRAPGFLGSCQLGFWGVATVKAAGDYAYLATGHGGLLIVDVSNPTSLVYVTYTLFGGDISDVAVAGDYAYAVDTWGQRITAVHASGPQIGEEAGGCPFYYGEAIAAEGTHLYATAYGGALHVFDISDPLHPTQVGECTTAAFESRTVAVSNGYAYIAGYGDGLAIVDVTQPAAPSQVAVVPAVRGIWDVAVDEPYAYLAEDEAGIRVLDISTPENPIEVGSSQTWGAAVSVAASGDSICVADYGWGFDVFHRAPVFTDVPDGYWAFPEIIACYRANILSGYPDGLYHPDWKVDRASMAVYISRALGLDTQTYHGRFPDDVPDTQWAWPWIEALAREGIVKGFDATHYRPDDIVNRDAMAVYVARSLVGGITVPSGPADGTFEDVPDYDPGPAHWAYDEIEYCVAHEVVAGYDPTHYRPDEAVTRDQMAVYVQRAFALGG